MTLPDAHKVRYDPEQVFADLMHDALSGGAARGWRKRADSFRAARPTPDDYPGQRTVEELRERWHDLTAVANACEARAAFLEGRREDWPEVDVVMQEVLSAEAAA